MKYKVRILILMTFLPILLMSQNRSNTISTNIYNPIFMALGTDYYMLDFKYERIVKDQISIACEIDIGDYYHYIAESQCYYELMDLKYSGYSFNLEARWYINSKTPNYGFLVGAYLKNMLIKEDYYWEDGYNNHVKSNETHYLPGIGVNLAYRFQIKRFFIEPLIGYGYCYKNSLGSNESMVGIARDPYLWPFNTKFKCNIGFKF